MNVDNSTQGVNPAVPPPLETPSVPGQEESLPPVPNAFGSALRARLLSMADGYRLTNAPHQALEMYFELLACHPDTPEAAQAQSRLLEIGDRYERYGEPRQARSIFERLMETV